MKSNTIVQVNSTIQYNSTIVQVKKNHFIKPILQKVMVGIFETIYVFFRVYFGN